jgi:hypothetical protein
MMPQQEGYSATQQHASPDYGRYEGNETSYAQEAREGPSGKVYPLPRDRMKFFRFALPVISLVLLVLFGLLFVVVVGGTAGLLSFAAACFVLCCVLAYAWSINQTVE